MPQTLRLTSSRDFARILGAGARGASPLLTCVAVATGADRPPRVGYAIGGRVGNAVKRNRARRLMREAVRTVCIERGSDVVLVGKPALAGRTLDDVRASLAIALAGAGVSC